MPPKEAGIEGAKDFLCRHLHHHYAGGGILPYCIHGRDDGTTVPRIQYCGLRFGDYLSLPLDFTPMLATKLLIKGNSRAGSIPQDQPFFEGMNRVYSKSPPPS